MPDKLTIGSKVKQILQAYTGGVSKSMISRKTGVSRNTVKRFIREFIAKDRSLEEILGMSDSALELLFRIVHNAHRIELAGESLRKQQLS